MSNLKIQGNASGAGTTTLQSGNTSNSVTFSLPIADGTSGQALITDGSGVLSFSGVGTDASNITSGTLAVARGGTGVTSSTGSGNTVLSTSPTLVTPVLGTPSSGNLGSCTADGTNAVGYRNIPASGAAKTASYILAITDVGKFVELGASGTITVPGSVFAAGDAISIFNNTGATITCTCSAVTLVYKGGTDADISTFGVTTRGVATVLFINATTAVITGNLA